MSFWDAMQRGAESALERHEEEVTVSGQTLKGVVLPVEVEEGIGHGGDKVMVGMTILLALEAGAGVKDGDAVTARGFTGKVLSRQREGAAWRVTVGPENRWDEEIPGL